MSKQDKMEMEEHINEDNAPRRSQRIAEKTKSSVVLPCIDGDGGIDDNFET